MLIAGHVSAMEYKIISIAVLPVVRSIVAYDVSALYLQNHCNTTVVCHMGWVSSNVIDRGNF